MSILPWIILFDRVTLNMWLKWIDINNDSKGKFTCLNIHLETEIEGKGKRNFFLLDKVIEECRPFSILTSREKKKLPVDTPTLMRNAKEQWLFFFSLHRTQSLISFIDAYIVYWRRERKKKKTFINKNIQAYHRLSIGTYLSFSFSFLCNHDWKMACDTKVLIFFFLVRR